MAVYDRMGGDTAFLAWARENPTHFYTMWSRAVPRESEALNRAAGTQVVILTADALRERRRGEVIDVTPDRETLQ